MGAQAVAEDRRLEAWVRLANVEGLGPRALHALLSEFGSAQAVLDASAASLARHASPSIVASLRAAGDTAAIERTLAWSSIAGNHVLTWDDPRYPRSLLDLGDTPVLLYCKGDPALLDAPSVAIVGSRNASPGGLATAEAFAEALASSGLSVVSGLALGIDAAAHRGALRSATRGSVDPVTAGAPRGVGTMGGARNAGGASGHSGALFANRSGSTLAVIGTGIDRVYPPRNRELAHEIAAHGAIVSEFPLETPPVARNFPRRNRLISGLSQGVLIVEATLGSGSLITARYAGEQGREVFAIPGSIHSPFSKGCHKLIKEGAKLVETAQDVLEELKWHGAVSAPASPARKSDTAPAGPDEKQMLDALGYDPATPDELCSRLMWPVERVLALLLQLELAGAVAHNPGGKVQRIA